MNGGRLRRFHDLLLNCLYPPESFCLCCGKEIDSESEDGLVCGSCFSALERLGNDNSFQHMEPKHRLPEGLRYLACAFPYRGEAKTLVYRLKYDHDRRAAIPLASAMETLPIEEAELIVPIPTTRKRQQERGFNQSEVLARRLGKTYGMTVRPDFLWRVDDHETQTHLTVSERESNVKGTMRAADAVRGKSILLIDDVYTTGATAREAVRALRASGCVFAGMMTACRAGLLYDRDSESESKSNQPS